MSIPENIDPYCAFALCFGIELPPEGKGARSEAMGRLCEYLDITPKERRRLKQNLAPALKVLRTWGTRELEWLDFPEAMKDLFQAFTEGFSASRPG